MHLFLYITLQNDPLYLPAGMAARIREHFPEVQFFHLDNHASPELVNTAIRALEESGTLVTCIKTMPPHGSEKVLFPVMKKIVQSRKPGFWAELGESPFHVYRNLAGDHLKTCAGENELMDLLSGFYA